MEPPTKRHRTPIVQLRELNEQYAGWIQEQLRRHPDDLWIDGTEDYIQHARTLLREASESSAAAPAESAKQAAGSAASGPPASAATSAPGWLPFSQAVEGAGKPPAPAGSVFSRLGPAASNAAPASSALGLGLFPPIGSTASTASLEHPAPFSFLNGGSFPAAAPAAPLVPSLPFLGASQPAPAPGLFSFPAVSSNGGSGAFAWGGASAAGASSGSLAAGASGNGGGAEGEDEEEGPKEFKPEVQLAAGATLLFKEPAKLFVNNKEKNTWDDRGQGTLTVRQQDGDDGGAGPSTQIVFTMESGRVLVNTAVYKGINPKTAKKPTMVTMNLMLVPKDPEEQDVRLHPMLLRFGAADKAASFISTVEAAAPK